MEDGPTIPDPPSPNNAPKIKRGVENPTTAYVLPGSAWTLDLTTIFRDADGDALTYTVKIGDAQPVAAEENYSYTPTERQTSFEFTASDETDTSAPYTVTLIRNTRPSIKSGSSSYASTIVGEEWTIDLSNIFEDADGDALTYSVSITGYNTESTPAVYSYTPTAAGQYSLNFSASDGLQGSPTYTVTLSASNPNHAPIVKAGVVNPAAAAVAVGQAYTLDLSTIFEDPDGSSLSYKVKVNDADAVLASRNYSYTPETAGDTTLVFTAVDNKGLESTATYTVTLTADASLRVITASTNDFYQWNGYTANAMGVVTVKVNGSDVVAAAPGAIVTVTATPQSILVGYAGAGAYMSAFNGWTAEGLTLTPEQAQNPELSFIMPDNAVTLTAAFVKVGSSVTLTANDFTAGDVSFMIGEWGNNTANSTWDFTNRRHGSDSVTDTVPGGKTVTAILVNNNPFNTAYTLARWEVVNTTTGEAVELTLDNPQNYPGTGGEYGQYYRASFTVDGTSSYTITAIFQAKDYGDVTVTVNDAAMGTATAQVGTAPAAGALEAVTAGQTVNLTAAPATGYVFTGWTATYGTTAVEITNANQISASFVMPETNKAAVNVTATFARDPQYASAECELLDLNLYDGEDNDFYGMDWENDVIEITLDEGVNAYYLPSWTLVLELSDYASATVNGVAWPAAGQAVGSAITLNEPATIVVTAEDGVTSATYTLTIAGEASGAAAAITDQSGDVTVKEGKTATFSVTASGSEALSYQWFYLKPGAEEWSRVSKSGTAAVYKLSAKAKHNGYQYKCVVTDGVTEAVSEPVTLTVIAYEAPAITDQSGNVTVTLGEIAEFSVTATGSETLSYQWYYLKPGAAEWSKVTVNGKAALYQLTAKEKHNGYQYKCVVSDGTGSATSEAVTLTVTLGITRQPADAVAVVGGKAVFTVAAAGENLTYQWFYLKPGSEEWQPVSNKGTSATYKLTVKNRHDGYVYKCVVTNANGSVESEAVTLTVG